MTDRICPSCRKVPCDTSVCEACRSAIAKGRSKEFCAEDRILQWTNEQDGLLFDRLSAELARRRESNAESDPARLVDAHQDRVHIDDGASRPGISVKLTKLTPCSECRAPLRPEQVVHSVGGLEMCEYCAMRIGFEQSDTGCRMLTQQKPPDPPRDPADWDCWATSSDES